MEPTISIVMAVYNGNKYIKEQINSIMEQTRMADEIIIIDDCSLKPCDDLIEKFTNSNLITVKYFKHEINQGYAKTFFDALSKSSGDIIFFADQDDVWMPNRIEEFLEVFHKYPNVLCLSARNIIIDGNGNEVKREKKLKKELKAVEIEELIKKTNIRPGMSIAIRKSIKDEIDLIDTDVYESHDRFIEYIACRENGFYLFGKYLTKHRIHGENTAGMNLSHTSLRSNLTGRIDQIDKEIRYLNSLKLFDNTYEQIIEKHIAYYKKRRVMLEKRNPFLYILGSINILYGYRDIRIWFGDILSMI